MGWKDDLAAARGAIHEQFAESALYFATGATTEEEAVACTVRVHDTTKIQGDLNGLGYAERAVETPRVVLLASEIAAPKARAIVELADGRRYKVDTVLPQHGVTITCEATLITPTGA